MQLWQGFKVGHRLLQPRLQIDLRLPVQLLLGQRNVRLPLQGVIMGQGCEFDIRLAPGQFSDGFGQFEDGELTRIAQIDRTGKIIRGGHQAHKGVNQVIDKAKGAGLQTVPVHR